jgi:hypothetical protein
LAQPGGSGWLASTDAGQVKGRPSITSERPQSARSGRRRFDRDREPDEDAMMKIAAGVMERKSTRLNRCERLDLAATQEDAYNNMRRFTLEHSH